MYVNKCTKCGSEFETKNPKRVICPNCLYPDKKMAISADLNLENDSEQNPRQESNKEQQKNEQDENSRQGDFQPKQTPQPQQPQQFYNSYSVDAPNPRAYNSGGYQQRPQNNNYRQRQSGYQDRNNYPRQGGYQRPQQGGYPQRRPEQGGYQRPQQEGYPQRRPEQGGYQRPQQGGYPQRRPQQGGYQRPQQGSYLQRRPQSPGGRFNKGPQRPQGNRNKTLLISKEQLEQIELMYKAMLPLPNPDAHEVIGAKIELEPRKVFFGINLIRQKMMLPKLPFPKRKLAISPDQMFAIQNLYEPLLPLPPIGCHKIIAAQLKMDEWRVHVGIGLVRAKMGLERWNQEREDAPEEFKKTKVAEDSAELKKVKKTKTPKTKKTEAENEEAKPKKIKKAKNEEKE